MPVVRQVSNQPYRWAAPGDVNAFFGLMLDNIADLLLAVSLLAGVYQFPVDFALGHMVPGTAIGVLVGDLCFFYMALTLARRTGRKDITAMPLGLDTPSTFGMIFFVLGPAFVQAKETMSPEAAAIHTWHIGICSIFISGLFKFACALGSGWIRRVVPRAGLLGSLAAIALVLISFLPLLEVLEYPQVGMISLAVILTTLVARVRLPLKVPGALGAMIVGCVVYYAMLWTGAITAPEPSFDSAQALLPTGWFSAFSFEWLGALRESVNYLPLVIPFALGTVVGGIDCTESAAAAGDEYDTHWIIGVEAVATLVAALCGGVIQTTPYIGHPAYKAMGGRAAYTLAAALFVGSAGVLGYFGYLYLFIPKATAFPILIFIGLEITAQSFLATPRRHYAAVALACVPALAALAMIYANKICGDPAIGKPGFDLDQLVVPSTRHELFIIRVLSGGFVVSSLLWAAALASLIDRRLIRAAAYFVVAGVCALFGIIHSPLKESPLKLPWHVAEGLTGVSSDYLSHVQRVPYEYCAAYFAVALLLLAWEGYRRAVKDDSPPIEEEA